MFLLPFLFAHAFFFLGTVSPRSQSADDIDYINSLRLSILEAYTGIVLGLTDGQKGTLFIQFVDATLGLFEIVADDIDTDEQVLDKAIGLIGDIAENMRSPAVVEKLRSKAAVLEKLIQAGLASADCKENAERSLEVRIHSDFLSSIFIFFSICCQLIHSHSNHLLSHSSSSKCKRQLKLWSHIWGRASFGASSSPSTHRLPHFLLLHSVCSFSRALEIW